MKILLPFLLCAFAVAASAQVANPLRPDQLNSDRFLHSNLRTTCVATLLDAGHATNALPQRASANVNCRIFPGHPIEDFGRELSRVIGDPGVSVIAQPPVRPSPPAPPFHEHIMGPM